VKLGRKRTFGPNGLSRKMQRIFVGACGEKLESGLGGVEEFGRAGYVLRDVKNEERKKAIYVPEIFQEEDELQFIRHSGCLFRSNFLGRGRSLPISAAWGTAGILGKGTAVRKVSSSGDL